MNSQKCKSIPLVLGIIAILIGAFYAIMGSADLSGEERGRVWSMLSTADASHSTLITPEQSKVLGRDMALFQKAMQQKDKAQQIGLWTQLLNSSREEFRVAAAQKLGATESKDALPPLKAKWQQLQKAYLALQKRRVQQLRARDKGRFVQVEYNRTAAAVQMAIARIETRALSGRTRVVAISRSIGLSLADLQQLFRRVNEPYFRNDGTDTEAYVVVDECIDIMESMAAKGQDISVFIKDWRLIAAQKARLQAASRPIPKRIGFLLNFLSHIEAVTEDNRQLAQRQLLEIGPQVNDFIVQQLQDMASHPQKYNNPMRQVGKHQYRYQGNFLAIFDAASMTRDKRVKPLLQQFINGVASADGREIRAGAAAALWSMEHEKRFYVGREKITIHGS